MAKTLKVKSSLDVDILDAALCNYIKHCNEQILWLKIHNPECSEVTRGSYQERIKAAKALLGQLREF